MDGLEFSIAFHTITARIWLLAGPITGFLRADELIGDLR